MKYNRDEFDRGQSSAFPVRAQEPAGRHLRLQSMKRTTGRKLQASRHRLFSKSPLCVMCQKRGKVTPAKHRDHIVALANGGKDTDDNVQALCLECHREKTASDLGVNYRPPTPVTGW